MNPDDRLWSADFKYSPAPFNSVDIPFFIRDIPNPTRLIGEVS